jgi:aminoglycoside 2'-N-acetyltransferase I
MCGKSSSMSMDHLRGEARALEIAVVPSARIDGGTREELLALCSAAYGEDFAPYLGAIGPAVHILGRLDGELVSHVAWVERILRAEPIGNMRSAYVEAVATLPRFQGRGIASALLRRIPPLVSDFILAALSPSDEAFYARLGWERWRGPLAYRTPDGQDVATPEEVVMIHRLPLTPATLDLAAPLSTDWRQGEVW